MPIYEYQCRKCGKGFEYMQRMSDPPKRKCEACGGMTLERQISQTSFHLKGSGWYKDLYSSPKPGAASGSESGSGSGAESGSGSDAGSGSAAGSGAEAGSSSKPEGGTGKAGASKDSAKPAKKAKKGSP